MHPALSLAKRKLEDARTEFDQLIAIEAEIIPVIAEKASPAAAIAKTSLRATGIEGVYTGMEGVLKEILTVVDGGVFSGPESWHAHLLAQAGSQIRRTAVQRSYRNASIICSINYECSGTWSATFTVICFAQPMSMRILAASKTSFHYSRWRLRYSCGTSMGIETVEVRPLHLDRASFPALQVRSLSAYRRASRGCVQSLMSHSFKSPIASIRTRKKHGIYRHGSRRPSGPPHHEAAIWARPHPELVEG
jgi:hypothetical protein